MTGKHLASLLDDGAARLLVEGLDAKARGLAMLAEHRRDLAASMTATAERARGIDSPLVLAVLLGSLKDLAMLGRIRTTARRFEAALNQSPIGGDTLINGDLVDRRGRPVRF